MQKRVLAIHDISGVGRCSLTVALPILSAAGVECSVLPTAVLSTHTGGFTGYTCRDLTADILPMARHWASLGLKFDAIYTGYLASFEQVSLMEKVFDLLAGDETLIVVDPVMGDNGRLYAAFNMSFPPAMGRLTARADIILPNMTEVALLTGSNYRPGPYGKDYIVEILKRVAASSGVNSVVLTGVYFDEERLGAATLENGNVDYILGKNIKGTYHGTGDVFASALVGAMMNGLTLREATRVAVDFTAGSIVKTAAAGTDIRYGVEFETELGIFMRELEKLRPVA